MKMIDGISMAAKDVGRRKLRSILTIIAIAVGCMLLVSMQGLGDTISETAQSFISSFGNLKQVMVLPQKYNPESSSMAMNEQMSSSSGFLPYTANRQLNPKQEDETKVITNDTLAQIAKLQNGNDLAAYSAAKATTISIDGVKKEGQSPLILGYSSEYKYTGQGNIVAGKDLTGAKNQILINESFLKDMGITDYESVIGKNVTIDVQMPVMEGMTYKKPLKIIAIVQGVYTNPNAYYPGNIVTLSNITNEINAYYTGENINNYKPTYSMVTIDVPSQKVIPKLSSEINKDLGYATFNLGLVVGMVSVFTDFIKVILDIAAIIVVVVASVGLINTMTMTVQEKRKWIGIMRSLGGAKSNIRLIFLTQSIILGIIGGIVGCLLAEIGIFIVNEYLKSSGKDFIIHLTMANVMLGFMVSIIVSIIAGIAPASRAAKLNVVETVNEE